MSHKTILYATDFSDAGTAAFEKAVELARDDHARMLIVHVQEPIVPFVGGEFAYVASSEPDSRMLESMLREVVPTDPSIAYEHRLLHGDPAAQIVELAEQIKPEMIVMGTHGRTGMTRIMLGSIAEQVIRRATCPVLTIRRTESTAPSM